MHDLSQWARCNNLSKYHRKAGSHDLFVYGETGGPLGVEWELRGVPGATGVCASVEQAKLLAEAAARVRGAP